MTTAHEAAPGRCAPQPGGTALLADYRPGGSASFFAGPHRTLLAEGVRARVPHGPAPLAGRVAETLRAARGSGEGAGAANPVVVGAVPFDHHAPAQLFVPSRVRWAGPLREDPLLAFPAPEPAPVAWRVRPVPAPGEYEAAVAAAVARMQAGGLGKAVLARTLELTAEPGSVDVPGMLHRLARRDPHGYTFATPAGEGRTLIGASPELLVSRRGGLVTANPLAGSAPRSADLAEDVRRAAALLESPKDLHEHAVVVDAVREALAPLCRNLHVPERPTLVRTAAMWHLSTTVTGEPAGPSVTALDLATALHPTPAVCGTPTDAARAFIRQVEPFDRGLYTGVVGWGDASGDGEWVVTIRCAEADAGSLRLFAGAGVVAGSRPEAELAETSAKFETFLHAVGADGTGHRA
ncbi:isochorismate synthase DhbC [Streptomyces sp. SCUT-3]|uniref:isochorismate synthase DhbC n=1 Tax=Streptomyces TaxID=1883 RepID=UPI0015FA0FC4|nr:isochorismate synthase DhbC [Streptomyces sp. SCUT-3]QMV21239.1 isochorismate synthase DhbC [Streptomyces sp. SCUT-3]